MDITKKDAKMIKDVAKYAYILGYDLTEQAIKEKFIEVATTYGIEKGREALAYTKKDFQKKAREKSRSILNGFAAWYMQEYGCVPTNVKRGFKDGDISIEYARRYKEFDKVAKVIGLS